MSYTRAAGRCQLPLRLLTALAFVSLALVAQISEPETAPESAQVESRAATIEAARDAKAAELEPEDPNKWESALIRVRDDKILERLSEGIAGVRLKFGGLAAGAGFALGPEYYREDFAKGQLLLRGAAQVSFTGAQKIDLELAAPRLANQRLDWRVQAVRHNYPRLNYYGPGPDSEKTGRSNFRLEDNAFDTTVTFKPVNVLQLGVSTGYLMVNTGPGTNKRLISAEQQYSPESTAGLDEQGNSFRYGFFAQVDNRDNPGGPRSGGSYTFQYNRYDDRSLDRFDFQRISVDLQQYFPLFNKRRVIALRARTNQSFTRDGQQVPFYLQPVLGGNHDLRGYRPFRFYGDNSIVMNAEWRWEVFSGLDMALFADAGKVYNRRSEFNFRNLESAAGFGMRFNARNNTFVRLDVGFSHEGYQVWFAFGDAFAPAIQTTSSNFVYQ
ncbi:MAG: BamA/TamA family outer membrane protein [Bryobacterales bacterium]|nr:BamA/TamA family outer membrane protein [Bryobacterales bacterium]